MAHRQWIEELKEKDKVHETYLVWRKNLLVAKNGKPYLNLQLGDKTGKVEARAWNHAEQMDGLFDVRDLVTIKGRAIRYAGSIQINVSFVERVEADEGTLRDFVPSSARPIEEMKASLEEYLSSIKNPHLRGIASHFLGQGPTAKTFARAPAAKSIHHAWGGGLLEHTLSVCGILEKTWQHFDSLYPGFLDRDLLLTGGLLHDVGKTWEIDATSFEYTDEGRLMGHLVMMHEAVASYLRDHPDFPASMGLHLKHIILSHHGELEHGSPKRPKTPEAWAIHLADLMDVRVAWLHQELSSVEPGAWTPFLRLHGRYFWRAPRPTQEAEKDTGPPDEDPPSSPAGSEEKNEKNNEEQKQLFD